MECTLLLLLLCATTPHAASSHAASSHAASSTVDEPLDTEDGICAVCQEPEGFEDNQIVFCDACDVGVHAECYGISTIPADSWYCDRCKQSRSATPACPACPNREGVFKRTLGGKWGGLAHVTCTLHLPGCGFLPDGTRDEAAGFDLIPKDHEKLKCSLCPTAEAKRHGYKIQCSHKKCCTAFHVTCAQRAGLHLAHEDAGRHGVRTVVYCKKHTPESRPTTEGKAKKPRKRKRR